MPLSTSQPSVRGAVRSFWFGLLDLPDDDQVQRLINRQMLATASPSTSSQPHLRYQYQPIDPNQATISNLHPPSQFVQSKKNKTLEQSVNKVITGDQVQFADSNQNSVYCVSSVNLSRLAFEEQSAGRNSAAAIPIVGSSQIQPSVPTPTQLTIATELPTATKFTTRPASISDKQKSSHIMHKRDFVEDPALCAVLLTVMSLVLIFCSLPFSLFFCIKVVQEYERAVIFRLGRLVTGGARGPGIFFIIPCIDTYSKVDLRTVSFDVPPQEILSKDSVTVAVDAVVYFRINNAIASVSNVEDYARSTRLLAATTLRNVLGTKNLSEILSERESISHMIQSSLDEATESWGVKVERVEIKDVRLPVLLQRAMAAEAEATREARAKVIAAEGEQRASRALKEAAEVISDSPAALQLRYLQTLSSIAAENNSTIVFPVPMELFRGFTHGDDDHASGAILGTNADIHTKSSHHHSHHSHHSHSNHHHSHPHDQNNDCEEFNSNAVCNDLIEPFDQNSNSNCHIPQQILTTELNFNPEEYLKNDLESPVPNYKE